MEIQVSVHIANELINATSLVLLREFEEGAIRESMSDEILCGRGRARVIASLAKGSLSA
jgi:hypothetical protein